jgi:SAM-dependent methyltransferase
MTLHEKLPQHLIDEMKARDAEASTYDSHLSDRYYREMVSTIAAIGDLRDKSVIEYGAGTGRFTDVLSGSSRLFLASDISLESLYVLARKNRSHNVGLVCGDAVALHTAPEFFDVALALQVIEHMPALEIRSGFYEEVRSTLKKGGFFVASVYHQDLRRMLTRKPIDGRHENGIPFHFFSTQEFKKELQKVFGSVKARPIDITLPLEKRLGLPPKAEGYISRICEYIPFLSTYGHLVLAKAST